MKNVKKSLFASVMSLLLCFSMLLGTTYAYFTDEATSANNKIQAGNLKVDLELLDKETGNWNSLKASNDPIFDYDRWEPGYVDAKILKVENEGNLALRWVAKLYSEKELSILADVIDVYVCPSETELAYPTDRSLDGYTCVGNLRKFINSIEETTYGALEAGKVAYLGIALKMREEAGNEYQELSLGGAFDIRIAATQQASESDSFNNIYDILADESIVAADSKVLTDGETAIECKLSSDNTEVASLNVPAEAILDPTQPVTVVFDAIDPANTIELGENKKAFAFDITVTNLKDDLADDQMITVVVAAPKGLPELKAYHNGVLVPDAVYDEVAGTITFKTSSFSPYAFEYTDVEVKSLEDLRRVVEDTNTDNLTLTLTDNLIIDLTKVTGTDRSENHMVSDYYNALNINKNIAIDLNGHSITVFCGNGRKDNDDVGALFFVNSGGSLNIIDRAGGGFIKMASSIYAVWAPYAAPSYVDIYEGIFVADSYAGDIIGTPVDANGNYDPENGNMQNENSNRTLIYAGTGGNINVYGGYFLYNNTINDNSNRNNGAFNAKDHYTGGTLITIHEGVYLSNKEYRQNPKNTSTPNGTFDDESVNLASGCKVTVNTVTSSIAVGDKTYNTWYKVILAYKLTYMDGTVTEETVLVEDNTNSYKLKSAGEGMQWIDKEGQPITSIPAGNKKDVVVYKAKIQTEQYEAIFVDKEGNVIAIVPFDKGATALDPADIPAVPEADGYIGSWETYNLKEATGSIVIKPVYSLDEDSNELFDLDIGALFESLSNGGSLVMSQELQGSQSNSSKDGQCEISKNATDNESRLNLNGYTLAFDYNANGNKNWNIMEILAGSTMVLTGGIEESGTLRMNLTAINNNAKAYVIGMVKGAKLTLEKGVVIELQYVASAANKVSLFNIDGMTQDELLAQYPDLKYSNENNVMRIEVIKTTTIEP